jgi:hypothetical protein
MVEQYRSVLQIWQPRYQTGDRVRVICGGMPGVVVKVCLEDEAYLIEVSNNPNFQILCTNEELTPAAGAE